MPEKKKRRRYRNKAEEAFCQEAEANGYEVSKRGWPDFICRHKGGRIVLVEVKPNGRSYLKKDQQRLMMWLASFGVPCFMWDPVRGFTPIKPPWQEGV